MWAMYDRQRSLLSVSKEVILLQENTTNSEERYGQELGTHLKFAIDALREGGLNENREEIRVSFLRSFPFPVPLSAPEPELGYLLFRAKSERGYQLGIFIGPMFEDKDENQVPSYGMVSVLLELPGSITARVLISRRTDDKAWTATTSGTLSLPVGHPLGELAHSDRFLGLSRERMARTLEPRSAELGLMEMARILERETR